MRPLVLILILAAFAWGTKPNIVLFVTDDQSPIAGCYGSPIIQTPHLNPLASEGAGSLVAPLEDPVPFGTARILKFVMELREIFV